MNTTQLREQYEQMVDANQGEPGTYTVAELMAARLLIIDAELAVLAEYAPLVVEQRKATAVAFKQAQQDFAAAQAKLLDPGQAAPKTPLLSKAPA
jgi:hypothetical protein